MAHHQKAVAAAVIINSAIFVVEATAGYQADSLSLITDSGRASASCVRQSKSRAGAGFSAGPDPFGGFDRVRGAAAAICDADEEGGCLVGCRRGDAN